MSRTRRAAAGIAGAAIMIIAMASPSPAAAAPPSVAAAWNAPTLQISSTADSLTAPATAAAGFTTFNATTTVEESGWVGLARLNQGVSWDQFRNNLRRTLSSTPSEIIAGSKDLAASARLLGGGIIHPGFPGSFTQVLSPGKYELFDYFDIAAAPQPRHQTLTVSGNAPSSRVRAGVPLPSATIISASVPGAGPRFFVTGTVRAGQPVAYVNEIPGQINEAIFVRVADGTTEAELGDYISKIGSQPPPVPPFVSFGLGSLPLSTGQSSFVQVPLQPGPYALLTFIKDAKTGNLLIQEGQYKIVQVR